MWTTNGFFVRRVVVGALRTNKPTAAEHHFLVRRGQEGLRTEVVVSIDPQALARVARACEPGNLSPAGAFWRLQAERAHS